jgi:hypothetical protein
MKRPAASMLALACAAAAVAGTTGTAGVAGAAGVAQANARARSPLGFAIGAVGFSSYFVFDARAGDAVRGQLRVLNLGERARTIVLRAADVTTASAGGLQYSEGTTVGDGGWLELSAGSVRLARGRSASVPFTVHVARTARAGDHFLGIVAIDRAVLKRGSRGHGAIRLRLVPRLAMTVQVRVPGRATRRLAVGRVGIAVAPSGASLALSLSNRGNRLISQTTGEVTVSQGKTTLFSVDTPLAAFVPKTSIDYHVAWQGVPVQGTYRVKGRLRPSGAPTVSFDRTVTFGSRQIGRYVRQTGRRAIASSSLPTALIVVLAVAIALAIAFAAAYARVRRQLRERD